MLHSIPPQYTVIETLYESATTVVYRVENREVGRNEVLKMLNKERPLSTEVAAIKREFEILQKLKGNGAIAVHRLERRDYLWIMVMEDFGGISLNQAMSQGVWQGEAAQFLTLAIRIAEILGNIHHHNLIHKDITPGNIIWNPAANIVKIIDFNIASELSQERQTDTAGGKLEGSLPYLSPEQTGRINREIDYRTDFYSLGITLYHLLFGRLPFTADDTIGWVYNHIAVPPQFPTAPNAQIPAPTIDILKKLMAKNPDDRYQSTRGLIHDLEQCRDSWQRKKALPNFRPGAYDHSEKFQIPHKLYGRSHELELLITTFDRVLSGSKELVLVAGHSGIGKTTLVGEVQKTIVQKQGFYLKGKFEQYQRDIPYNAIISALNDLVSSLLTLPDDRLAIWRHKFLQALGPNIALMIELLPKISAIAGTHPPIQELNPIEAQNRLMLTFKNFFNVLATAEHPLGLFLDDLHWADPPSLDLIKYLMTTDGLGYLFILGAYRDHDAPAHYPLTVVLEHIGKRQPIHRLTLSPLDQPTINRMVADTLHCPLIKSRSLAAILYERTQGNPFFFNALFHYLYQNKHIQYLHDRGAWHWNLQSIKAMSIADNVVDYMIARLQELPQKTQEVLKLASCIGGEFQLRTLALIEKNPLAHTANHLWSAIEAGIIHPMTPEYRLYHIQDTADTNAFAAPLASVPELDINVTYRFGHDRIQQAAYALIDPNQKQHLHLEIGRLLLRHAAAAELPEKIIEIVSHFNEGIKYLTDPKERAETAELNSLAAKKAKLSAAFRSALEYITRGMELLPLDSWSTHRELSFDLYREHCECSYICGNFMAAEASSRILLDRADSALQQAEIYSAMIKQYNTTGKPGRAIETGLTALRLLGIEIPRRPARRALSLAAVQAHAALGNRMIADLLHEPIMEDPGQRIAMTILPTTIVAAYLTRNHSLFTLMTLTAVNLTLRHGHTPESAMVYGCYGVILGSIDDDYPTGFEFGKLAVALNEKFNHMKLYCFNLFTYTTLIHHWNHPWTSLSEYYRQVIRAGLESGDLIFLAYSCINIILWNPDLDLETAIREGEKNLTIIGGTNYPPGTALAQILQHWRLNWQGGTNGPTLLSTADFDEYQALDTMMQGEFFSGVGPYYLYKAWLCYAWEDYPTARQHIHQARQFIGANLGQPYIVDFSFFSFLIAAALYPQSPTADQRRTKRQMREELARMKIWSEHCPANFMHYRQVMEAEWERLAGNEYRAAQGYDQAIESARRHGFLYCEALIHELAAKHYLAGKRPKLAAYYLEEAGYLYTRWGATAKVSQLAAKYPVFRTLDTSRPALAGNSNKFADTTHPKGAENAMQSLDIDTIVKASQTLSSAVELEKLLTRFIHILCENAGAETVLIFLVDESTDRLLLQAESRKDRQTRVLHAEPLEDQTEVSTGIIQYVARSHDSVVLGNACQFGNFILDDYVREFKPLSVLCLPILNQGKLIGILYLENNQLTDAFTEERLQVLGILASQAAISINNAYVYTILEEKVRQRTRELSEKNTELMRLNAEKSEFMDIAAHDLKSPLSTIRGLGQLISESLNDFTAEEITEYLDLIVKSAQRMIDLVKDLLNVNAIELGELKYPRENVDLRFIAAEVKQQFHETAAAKKITLHYHSSDTDSTISANRNAIHQILENLVANAIKFSPWEATVWMNLENIDGVCQFTILDQGPGIPEEYRELIFEKYVRARAKPTGGEDSTGLGLNIVKKLVETMDGRVWCENSPGAGAIFIVEFRLIE